MSQSAAKPEFQAEPLTPSQAKAKKLIEELTESIVEKETTEEANMAQEFLQGIWHGNAIPGAPRQTKRKESPDPSADKGEPNSP